MKYLKKVKKFHTTLWIKMGEASNSDTLAKLSR